MNKLYRSIYNQPIDAIVPTYDINGNNVCQMIYTDGTSIIHPLPVNKCIRQWFQVLRIDLYAYRIWAQEILHQRNGNPIVIHEQMVFISVKMRKPIGSKDGASGYVRIDSIKNIENQNLCLYSGVILPCLYTPKTIEGKIKDAKLLEYTYVEERQLHDQIYRKKFI